MMFARDLVDETRDGGVRNLHARLGERVGRPDVREGPASTVNPKTRILRVPGTMRIGVGGVGGVVGVHACAIRIIGAVTAQEANVVYHRALTGAPEKSGGAGVEAAGENAEACDD